MLEVHQQDTEQHQHRAHHRVQEEFDRRIEAARPPPDGDQEVHRHQHRFPEGVKQEEVEGQKDAEHASLQQQKENVVFLGALGDVPGTGDGDRAQQGGEQHQQQRNTVQPQRIAGANRRNPRQGLAELEMRPGRLETKPERQADGEAQPTKQVGDAAQHTQRAAGHGQQQERAQGGRQQHDGQQMLHDEVHEPRSTFAPRLSAGDRTTGTFPARTPSTARRSASDQTAIGARGGNRVRPRA